MIKRFLYIILSLLFIVPVAVAGTDNTGTSAANFLKIGVGSRGNGLGGAFVAQVNDVSALYWNPAGIANITSLEVGISYTDWILDIKHNFLGVVYPLGRIGTIGLSFVSLSMGDMETTTPLEPDGTGAYFSSSDLAMGITYARQLTDRFQLGASAKFIHESISFSSASTFAIDAGTQFDTGYHGLKIGMSICNFGGKMTLKGTDQIVKTDIDEVIDGNPEKEARLETEGWSIPLIFRFGLSMDVLNRGASRMTCNLDFNDLRDNSPYSTFGAEYVWNNMLALRGGLIYRAEDFDEDKLIKAEELELIYDLKFAFGAGFYVKIPGMDSKVRMDYSYNDLGILTSAHSFSFSFGL
ncbi:MAG: PorV/PorQ family protein [Candidatus Zhuqueibacterota bacterium]